MPPLRALWGLFFVSGATSLVYQTVWARELHLVLGTSSFAISTVLAAFMGGLGLGGALAARVADRVERPLRAYAVLEAAIGLYALALPLLVQGLATPAYLALFQLLEPGPTVSGISQALLAGVLLLPPTAAMGATLPLLARLAVVRQADAGDQVGALYAINTAGALVGTGVAGLWLLPAVGLWTTTILTASGNLLLAAVAWWVDRGVAPRPAVTNDLMMDLIDGPVDPDVAAVVVIGIGGAASLACEVAWTRLVALVLGGTTYAFTAMLLAVLLGIAVGGRLGGELADLAFRRGGTRGVLRSLALVEAAIGLSVWGLTFVWTELPYWFVYLYDALSGGEWVLAPFAASLVVSVMVLLPPATLMGVAFPLAVRAAAGDGAAVGRPVAAAYAANTLGGVLGASLAGFWLLPTMSVRSAVGIAAAANLLAAAIAWARGGRVPLAVVAVAAMAVPVLVQAPWDPMWMSGGLHHYVSHFERRDREAIRWFATGNQELLFYDEGLSTVVTVGRNVETGNVWLANNGKVDASSSGDMPTQVLCALLALQHVDDPRQGVVVGLASGVTAGAASLLPGLESLEVVELEPAIFEAARFFDEVNFGVLDNPKVDLIANDGRNHVMRAPPGRWGWAVSEPPNPYLSGVANLFTLDFWQMGRTRLQPGGIWSQWVQLYGMGPEDARSLLRTFADTYPYIAVYAGLEETYATQPDVVLVGSDRPVIPSFERARGLLADPQMRQALARVGVERPEEIVAMHAMDREALLAYVGDGPRVTDDNMRIEYSAPLHLHQDTQIPNWHGLRDAAQVPWDHLPDDPALLGALADAYEAHGSPGRAGEVRTRLERAAGYTPQPAEDGP